MHRLKKEDIIGQRIRKNYLIIPTISKISKEFGINSSRECCLKYYCDITFV